MPISQYVDTFFFISLGVTFILLFLVAFHFKTRIGQVERKNETLTEICTTLVSEIGLLKTSVQNHSMVTQYDSIPNVRYSQLDTMIYNDLHKGSRTTDKTDYIADDVNDDDSSTDTSSSGEEADDEENDEESDEENDEENDDNNIIDEENAVSVTVDPVVLEDEHKIVLMDQSILDVSLVESDSTDDIVDQIIANDIVDETMNEIINEIDDVDGVEEVELDIQSEMTTQSALNRQLQTSSSVSVQPTGSLKEMSMNGYKKLTIQKLRTVVIREGLCTDPSKMKKQELLNTIQDALQKTSTSHEFEEIPLVNDGVDVISEIQVEDIS